MHLISADSDSLLNIPYYVEDDDEWIASVWQDIRYRTRTGYGADHCGTGLCHPCSCSGPDRWRWPTSSGDSGRRILAHSQASRASLERLSDARSPDGQVQVT